MRLVGQLANALSQRHAVRYELHARTGDRTADAIARLDTLPDHRWDVVVTSLGVNDVTGGVSLERWLAQQRELRRRLVDRHRARTVVVSGLPPMGRFPALPRPLRGFLGRRATRFTRALQLDIAATRDALFLPVDFALDTSAMASDGFHPGPPVYRAWASHVAALLEDRPDRGD